MVADSGQRSPSVSINPEVSPASTGSDLLPPDESRDGTNVEPAGLIGPIKREIQSAIKDQPVYQVMTMEEAIAKSISTQRFVMTMLLIFATLALVLASVGVTA